MWWAELHANVWTFREVQPRQESRRNDRLWDHGCCISELLWRSSNKCRRERIRYVSDLLPNQLSFSMAAAPCTPRTCCGTYDLLQLGQWRVRAEAKSRELGQLEEKEWSNTFCLQKSSVSPSLWPQIPWAKGQVSFSLVLSCLQQPQQNTYGKCAEGVTFRSQDSPWREPDECRKSVQAEN